MSRGVDGARGFSRAAAGAAALLLLGAASVPMKTIDKGSHSRIDAARRAVVRTPPEWARLWTEHAGERARPAVDFGRETIVAVFLGSRPTAGFGVEIVEVREEEGTTVVRYRETRPGPGTVTAQVVTSPYDIVAVPRRQGEIRFEQVEKE